MHVKKIDHIGIAVESLDDASVFYRDALGLESLGVEEVPSQKVRVAMFKVGESKIELLEPTSPDSPIAAFLEKKGQGIHHIAYSVSDASGAVSELLEKEVQMIDKEPRPGAGGSKIAFVHPKSSGRVLTELCQH
ncbi:MAG TPA: methylmalonyl-CoA epimerase [Candidatus Sabulitectum sp.]|nr:methylmalonyl-CoA epimerase [Candidatus Sabulitectum sp.]HPJ29168.1 methylmalonyl-CoA epimerase [Candidatus Sabulitectum sp.]HPR23018.1 methylmalonyl-CoA epimerase [Candidatus Sabulitectum sp.]